MSDPAPEVTKTTLQAGDREFTVSLSRKMLEDGPLDRWWAQEAERGTLRIVEGHDAE